LYSVKTIKEGEELKWYYGDGYDMEGYYWRESRRKAKESNRY